MKITKADKNDFVFAYCRKKVLTPISETKVPAGTEVETLEGWFKCAEESRIAVDSQGNIYPIAESIYQNDYETVE